MVGDTGSPIGGALVVVEPGAGAGGAVGGVGLAPPPGVPEGTGGRKLTILFPALLAALGGSEGNPPGGNWVVPPPGAPLILPPPPPEIESINSWLGRVAAGIG